MNLKNKWKDLWDLAKPYAETSRGWREWENSAKQRKPVVFFIRESLPHWCRNVWYSASRPFSNAAWWVRYRTTHRYHVVRTGREPGYHDLVDSMLWINFTQLVDFVEIEKANKNIALCPEWRHARRPTWKRWIGVDQRIPDAGLDYLKWETQLDEDSSQDQAHAAQEIMELYHWWTVTRPNRPDPSQASGWNDICQRRFDNKMDIFDNHDDENVKPALDMMSKIEQEYWEEDQRNMKRLIDIRAHLWA